MNRPTRSSFHVLLCLLSSSLAGACSSSTNSTDPDPLPIDGPACQGSASSDLPGVSVEFPDDRCSFSAAEAAAGLTIGYTVVVANTLVGVSPTPLDAGHCNQPDPAFGLTPLAKLSAQDQQYCQCDVGGCFQDPANDPVTNVTAGRYDRSMAWTGKNWFGPSDTNNQMGAAFPPGTYTFNVTAKGTWLPTGATARTPFTVSADRTLTITP